MRTGAMSKIVLCVSLVLPLFLSANCRFNGDRCEVEGTSGTCKALEQCQPLLEEIRLAGTPMPMHIRRKLQALTCGYDTYEPIVCCLKQNDDTSSFPHWSDVTYGMGVHNDNKETRPEKPSSDVFNPLGFDNKESNVDKLQPTVSNTPRPDNQPNRPDLQDGNNNKSVDSLNNDNENPPEIGRHRNLRLLPTDCGIIESDRIWGGNRTRLFEMPWMILIAYQSARGTKLSCGGTLINEWYVLTAAHCVSFLGNRLKLDKIILGEYDVTKDPDCERVEGELVCAPRVRNVSIDSVIPHPGYSPQNLFDDIALVRLAEPADFTLDSMKPICLPTTTELQTENLAGMQAVVAGWGSTEDGIQSSVLLSVDLPVIANKDCQSIYNGSPRIYNRQMCAGGVQDKDSCGGDSGGPLMYAGRTPNGVRYVQRGIVSYGSKRCGIGGFPGVYTRVAHYMDWILDNIRN